MVFDVEVRKCAMDMGANLLSRFSGSKYPNDWDLRLYLLVCPPIAPWQLRVKFCGRCLVVIDAVEPYAKEIH